MRRPGPSRPPSQSGGCVQLTVCLSLTRTVIVSPFTMMCSVNHSLSIRDLVSEIAEATGFDGEIRWDRSKPNGQPRRCLDTRLAEERFGFRAEVPLDDGLREIVEWYLSHSARAA